MSTSPTVKKALSGLLRDPKNNSCADCKAQSHPRWSSWSLGVFICIKCAGIHRSLGTHISKVKSVDLDTWKEEHLAKLISLRNNEVANRYYEARLPDSQRKPITDGNRLQLFIRNKYENKKWIGDAIPAADDEPAAAPSAASVTSASSSSKESIVSAPEPTTKQASTSSNLLDLQLSSAPRRAEETKRREDAGGRPDLKKSILSLYSKPVNTTANARSMSSLSLSPSAAPPKAASVESLDDNELFKNPDLHLEGVVDQPLETRQRTDHHDSDHQTVPQPAKPDRPVDPARRLGHRLALPPFVVDLGHHHVCRVRHDRAQNSRQVPAGEADRDLLQRGHLALAHGQPRVDRLHDLFERGKLAHRVRDLSAPQRHDPLVEPADALVCVDLREPLEHVATVGRDGRLLSDFDRLKRAQEHVRDELRRRRCRQVHARGVARGGLRAQHAVRVEVLEKLVPAVLTRALQRVPDRCGPEPREHLAQTLGPHDRPPAVYVGPVQARVHLQTTLDQVQRRHGRVRGPAGDDPTQCAGRVKLRSIQLNLVIRFRHWISTNAVLLACHYGGPSAILYTNQTLPSPEPFSSCDPSNIKNQH